MLDSRTESAPSAEAAVLAPHTTRKPLAFGWRVLCGFGVGLLLAACFPPFRLPFLLPLAIAGLLALLEGVTVREGTYIGLACGFAFFGASLFWLTGMFGVSAISLWAIEAIFPALFAGLYVWLRRRLPGIPVWLLAAVVWTATEYFRSELMRPNFAWMGLGYALVDSPLAVAPAAWFGSYGLTFALVAFGANLTPRPPSLPVRSSLGKGVTEACTVVSGLLSRLSGREDGERTHHLASPPSLARTGFIVRARREGGRGVRFLLWLALLLIPRAAPTPPLPLAVRLVQANSEDEESLFGLSQAKPGERWDVIVWPEYSFASDPTRNPKLWQKLAGVAQTNRAYFLFGAKDQFDPGDDAKFRNTVFLFAPDGRLIGRHVKNHTVHFIQDGVAGTEAQSFPTALGRLGIGTCFDLDFPDVARRLTQDGAEALLVPSDNPAEWGPIQHSQHRQLFQMRAVECQRWLATTDVAGNTFVVAPTGYQIATVSTTEPTALNARIGRETGRTLFVRGGWRFGQLCLLALVALCVGAASVRKRPEARPIL